MGYYIPNNIPLSSREGVKEIPVPKFEDIPADKALICEVDNIHFKANGLIYSKNELSAFLYPEDTRRKRWFLMDKEQAHELAGYK